MKKQISLLLTFFAMAIMVHAQAPNAIPYQGVARNSSGSILASQAIRLRFTIHDVTSTGTTVYQETQAVTTSTLGLFNVNIGQGTIVSGTLSGVNWGTGAKFLQVEMDPAGGTNYISMGTTQLNSVPYALFAGGISNGAGWSLSGNAPPNDTSFIGTISNTSFNIRVNNQKAGRIDNTLRNSYYGLLSGNSNTTGGFNTGIGWSSLSANTGGNYNTAIGYGSLLSNTTGNGNLALGIYSLQSNTTGSFNAAIGYGALNSNTTGTGNFANGTNALYYNTTGNYNTANGYTALQNNTTGNYNNAIGYGALVSNTTGSYNSAAGYGALYYNTTGIGNAAYGPYALVYNGTGNYNTAMGDSALIQNYAGINNSAFGYNALSKNAGGIQNTAIGYRALATNTYGNNNTAVGDSADVASANLSNATAVGYKAIAPASNTIQLGNTTIDSVMAGTLSANTKLVVPRIRITGGALAANNILTSDALGNATWQPAAPSGWSLSGNAGTVDGTNFIGTTDNTPFNIRMNNQKAGRIDSSLRTTFYGYQSGGSTTTGGYNTANGYKSLFSNTTGAYNTAHGYKSLYSNTTGANNTANGDSALYSNTSGGFNTAHGYAALASNTTGSNNTAIGDSADVTTGALTNATAIGYNAKVSVSNTIQLGNAATDSVMAGSGADSTKLIIPRLRVTGGTPAVGKVLTATDVNGNAKWQTLPSGFPTATAPGQMVYWNGSAWVIVPAGTRGLTLTYCEGVPTWGACPAIYATVTTTVITGITNVSASGGGNVTYNGDANVTARGIVWGTDTLPSIATHLGITTDGSGNGAFTSSLTGLLASTKYHVRAYATNSVGTSYGVDTSFTTAAAAVPTVATVAPSAVGSTTANPGGNISSNGGATVSQSGIVYSTSNVAPTGPLAGLNPGTYSYTTDGNTTSWTSSLTNLSLGTPYYTYAYANNIAGTGYGGVQSFTTIALPTVTTTTVSSITATSASGGGNVTADGGATVTERGVCWGPSANPTTAGSHAAAGVAGTGSYVLNLSPLTGATFYHYRAYATNSAGTSYGTDLTFTTTISVGDSYQGGKVFYLLQSGDPGYDAQVQHGLIAATADTSSTGTWYNGSYTTTGATATALGSGLANTNAIISSQGAGTYAASLCKAYTAGGLYPNVWYLPSKDELNLLYGQKATVGGFTINYYWSSTEIDANNAWLESFLNGNTYSTDKSTPTYVRPIRSF